MLLYHTEEGYKDRMTEETAKQGVVDFSCPNCGDQLDSRQALIDHMAETCTKMTEEPDQPLPRTISSSSFDVSPPSHQFMWNGDSTAKQSAGDDSNSRRFPCEHCEKHFTDPSNLQRHIRSQHMGARSHACPECGKTFATSSGLKQHQHIHSSVKPFQCEVCLKAYTQFSNLCRHKRMHADCRQQIKCADCGQAFSTITSLSKHKRFCEGVLRNGIPLNIQNEMKAKLPAFGMPHASSAFNSSLYMRLYGSRPTFPFYPQLGAGLPSFPFGNAFDGLKYLHTPQFPGSVDLPIRSQIATEHDKYFPGDVKRHDIEHPIAKRLRVMHDLNGSDGESEHNHSSDGESVSDVNAEKRRNDSFDSEKHEIHTRVSPVAHSHLRIPEYHSSNASPSPSYKKSDTANVTNTDAEDISREAAKEQPLDLSRTGTETVNRNVDTHVSLSPIIEKTKPQDPVLYKPYASTHPISPVPRKDPLKSLETDTKERISKLMQESPQLLQYPRYPLLGGNLSNIPFSVPNPYSFQLQRERQFPSHPIFPTYPDYQSYATFQGSQLLQKSKDRYSCKFCGKLFPRSANLTRHLRTHTGEQPYHCQYCERSFSISSNLQRHVRNIHNKEKPHRCPLCDRAFGQQTNLDRHLKKHETDGPNVIDSPTHESEMDDDVFEDTSMSDVNAMSDSEPNEDEDIDISENDADNMVHYDNTPINTDNAIGEHNSDNTEGARVGLDEAIDPHSLPASDGEDVDTKPTETMVRYSPSCVNPLNIPVYQGHPRLICTS